MERVKTKDRIRFETSVGEDFIAEGMYGRLCLMVRRAGVERGEAFMEAAAPATMSGRIRKYESGEVARATMVERRDMFSPLEVLSLALRKGLVVRLDLPAGHEDLADQIRRYLADPVGYNPFCE